MVSVTTVHVTERGTRLCSQEACKVLSLFSCKYCIMYTRFLLPLVVSHLETKLDGLILIMLQDGCMKQKSLLLFIFAYLLL